ncbi:MAG: hypothetical protein ACYDAO_04160 [Thermoplasmataceae archaeon]
MTEQQEKQKDVKDDRIVDIIKPETLMKKLNQFLAVKVNVQFKIDALKEDMKAHRHVLKEIDAKIIETHRLIKQYTITNAKLSGHVTLDDFSDETLDDIEASYNSE